MFCGSQVVLIVGWHRVFGRGGASHRSLFSVSEGVWAVSCVALLNVDTVSVCVTVCCSLSGNDLEAEGGKAIAAAMQHTPNMKSLE